MLVRRKLALFRDPRRRMCLLVLPRLRICAPPLRIQPLPSRFQPLIGNDGGLVYYPVVVAPANPRPGAVVRYVKCVARFFIKHTLGAIAMGTIPFAIGAVPGTGALPGIWEVSEEWRMVVNNFVWFCIYMAGGIVLSVLLRWLLSGVAKKVKKWCEVEGKGSGLEG